jgi:hypothetical protein
MTGINITEAKKVEAAVDNLKSKNSMGSAFTEQRKMIAKSRKLFLFKAQGNVASYHQVHMLQFESTLPTVLSPTNVLG